MRVQLGSPVVVRMAGLPFERLRRLSDRAELWSLLDCPDFLGCLVSIHPSILKVLQSKRRQFCPDRRPSNIRRAELTLYRYLARFCSRNDTTGRAGSTFWGRWSNAGGSLVERQSGIQLVVYPSPRHSELMTVRASQGPMRGACRLVLRSHWIWRDRRLLNASNGLEAVLSQAELELLEGLRLKPQRWEELTASQRNLTEQLESRGILASVLGEHHQDRLVVLLENAPEGEWRTKLTRLRELSQELVACAPEAFCKGMEEADQIARALGFSAGLNHGLCLRELVSQCLLSEWELPVQLSSRYRVEAQGIFDRFQGRQLVLSPERAEWLASGFRAQHRWTMEALDEGILGLSPSALEGNPWLSRFESWVSSLSQTSLNERMTHRIQLLRQTAPGLVVEANPLAAEADLAARLESSSKAPMPAQDRSFFISDSRRDIDLCLSAGLRERLEGVLEPWFRLAAWSQYREDLRLRRCLTEVIEPGQTLPWLGFAQRLAQQLSGIAECSGDFSESPWSTRGDPQSLLLQIEEAGSVPEFDDWLRDKRLVTTMDLLLEGNPSDFERGQGTLVMGEAHWGCDDLGTTTFFPQAHPGEVGLTTCFPGDTLFFQSAQPGKPIEAVLLQLRNYTLGIRVPESWWPQERSIPAGELEVYSDPLQGLQLRHGGQAYRLVSSLICLGNVRNLGINSAVLRHWAGCYSIPNFQGHGEIKLHPELRLGELVLTRWTVELSLGALQHLLPQGQLVSLFGLPRFVFVKINQGKPCICDLESPLSTEALLLDLDKARGTAQISPFRPGASDLWLELKQGRFTSELRFTAWADGPDFAQAPGLHFALRP